MDNLVVNITVPRGLRLTNGASLAADTTFEVVSRLNPFYAAVDQVRLEGGLYLRKLPALTIAAQIYDSSNEADLITPQVPSPDSSVYKKFVGARNQWVVAKAVRNLMLGVVGLLGVPGAHVLANFSVSRGVTKEYEGIAVKLQALDKDLELYEPVLRTGGQQVAGGHPKAQFAAKGVFDWTERTPARTWFNTGLGANSTSQDFGSPTGGRGKPVKFFASTFFSSPIVNIRSGIYQGAYPMSVTWPTYPGIQ